MFYIILFDLLSYTLECNYNSGRMLNPVPPATCDNSRATPPPPPGFPPKFTTEIYQEVHKNDKTEESLLD